MISVIIPTINAETRLPVCLEALVSAAVGGLVRDVIIVDGGSDDETRAIAGGYGTKIITAPPGRGGQLKAGAENARGEWLLFLHGDSVLEEGWEEDASALIAEGGKDCAGVFTLQFDAKGLAPRIVAAGAMLRTRLLKSPYGDQGLLVSRELYDEIGGFSDIPLMEDVDFIKRLIHAKGGGVLRIMKSNIVTSAVRYERDGYFVRVINNAWQLVRFHAGVAPEILAKSYR